MAEICTSIAAKVAELLVDPIGRQISYVFKYQRNMEELKEQVKMLTNQKESVQHSVDEANRRGDEIEKQVQEWLDSVDEFVKKVVKSIIDDQVKVQKLTHERESVQHSVDKAKGQGDEIEKKVREWLNSAVIKPITDDSVKANKLCSTGFCPTLMTRYSLSKKAMKTAKDGFNLLGQGNFQKVSYRLPPQRANSIYIKGYEDFASRMSLSERIMKALTDTDTDLIGVYGMGGVGKTTLVKKVAQQAKENKLFDVVVTAVVTEKPDIGKIQGQIADELGLEFREESESGRAARLRERMKKENKILVILDNVWAQLDFESIGIPIAGDEKKSTMQKVNPEEGETTNKRQCKILLTSRRLDVLRDDMDIQKNFPVDILDYLEAESLFWKTVRYSEEKSYLNPIAVEIIRKCGGLPLAIKTISTALKNKSLHVWNTALDELKKANPINTEGIDGVVYSALELSFNLLKREEAKSLFLLCGLCNSGYGVNITDMLKYIMGSGLFKDVDTIEEGRNKLHTLIDDLKTSCLLIDDDSPFVKMHDIIHVVAVSIASTTKLWYNLQDVAGLKEALEKKLPKDLAAVSLRCRDIYKLPEEMEFPKLELFLLYSEDASLQIPDAVFEGMKGLKVLDMSGIHLMSPPSSLCCLINLHTLCLNSCRLKDVAIIGELNELEVLSFMKSDIKQLPREIGQLTNLRLLDLSHCSKLEVIKPNVISSLTHLEELYMGDSFDRWDIKGQSNASIAELKQLSCLTALDIQIPDAQIIPEDLSFGKLERYRIFIGGVWHWSGKYETSRTLKLKLSSSIYLSNEIKSLLNRSEEVHLYQPKGVKSVVYELSGEGFPQLKHLQVHNGSEIQYIANSFGWGSGNVFPRLESLFFHCLINLETICHGQLATKSFSKLRTIEVRNCDRLKHLFPFSMVNNLLQLQEIEVTNCKKLEEIISMENTELVHQNKSIRAIDFTQLHTLTLECLPQLTSFSFNASTPDIGSQEIVAEDEADSFMCLFSQNVVLPSLKNLKLSSINIRCTWLDQLPVISSCCQALTNLTLQECNDLKFLFSYSVVKSLVQLQKLKIRNCKSIEGIINTEELRGDEKMIMMVFPKLLNLQLRGLPTLARFGSGNSIEFLSLTQISIKDCPKLKTFFSGSKYANIKQSKEIEEMNCQDDIYHLFHEKVVFPCLKELKLRKLPKLLHLWKEDSQHSIVLENLTDLNVSGCENLKTLVPSSLSLQKLRTLKVQSCNGLMNLMTFSKATTLLQLETMDIGCCEKIEEVMTVEGEKDAAINKTIFSKLNSIKLWKLPYLKSFYSGSNTLQCPSLTTINIQHCLMMETFLLNKDISLHSATFFSEKAMSSCLQNLTQLIMFYCDNLKYIFPSSMAENLTHLEVLDIRDCKLTEGVIMAQDERKSSIRLPKLNLLILIYLPKLTRFCNFNGNSIELPSLSELIIHNCPKMQTFASNSLPGIDEPEEVNTETEENLYSFFDEKVAFSCLNKLKLSELPKMLHLWKENSQSSKVFENLTYLKVTGCGNLKTLVPSSASLQNLSTLEVRKCDGLINLVSFSTAKSLEQLKRMEIIDCKLIEQIIIDRRDEIQDGIVFNQLEYLKLCDLPSLTSFCKGSFIIKFPYLQRLLVIKCLNMMNFSRGVLSTPLLQRLRLKEEEDEWLWKLKVFEKDEEDGGCWIGALNTAIQKLFKDRNAESCKAD